MLDRDLHIQNRNSIDNSTIESLIRNKQYNDLSIRRVTNGYSIVTYESKDSKYTNILYNHKLLFDEWFDGIYYSENGYLPFIIFRLGNNGNEYNMITTNWNLAFNSWAYFIDAVEIDDRTGRVGDVTIPNCYFIYVGDEVNIIDGEGHFLSDVWFNGVVEVWEHHSSLYSSCYLGIVKNKEGKSNIFNFSTHSLMLDTWYDTIRPYKNFCEVKLRSKYNFINYDTFKLTSNIWVDGVQLWPKLEYVDGIKVILKHKINYIRNDGTLLFKTWFESGTVFDANNTATVTDDNNVYTIDKQGNMTKALDYQSLISEARETDLEKIQKHLAKSLNIDYNNFPDPLQYVTFENFYNGYRIVSGYINEKIRGSNIYKGERYYNFIDAKNNIVFDKWFNQIYKNENNYDVSAIIRYYKERPQDWNSYDLYNIVDSNCNLLLKKPADEINYEDFEDEGVEPVIVIEYGKNGNFLKKDGTPLFDTWFDRIEIDDYDTFYYTCRCPVLLNGKWNVFNARTQSLLLNKWVDSIYHDGYFYYVLKNNNKYALIDKDGQLLIDRWCDYIDPEINYNDDTGEEGGWALIEIGGKKNIYNTNDKKFVLNDWAEKITSIEDILRNRDEVDASILFLIQFSPTRYNFLTEDGTLWFDFDFESYYGVPTWFADNKNYGLVCVNGLWNFYRRDGKTLLPNGVTKKQALKVLQQIEDGEFDFGNNDDNEPEPLDENILNERTKPNNDTIKQHFINFLNRAKLFSPDLITALSYNFMPFYNGKTVVELKMTGLEFYNVLGVDNSILFDDWFSKITISKDPSIPSVVAKLEKYNPHYNLLTSDGNLISTTWASYLRFFDFDDTINSYYNDGTEVGPVFIIGMNNKFNILNKKGEPLCNEWLSEVYHNSESYYTGCFIVQKDDRTWNIFSALKCGFLMDKWVSQIFEDPYDFYQVKYQDKYNLIDNDGEFLLKYWSESIISWFYDSVLVKVTVGGKVNIFNTDNREFILNEWAESVWDIEDIDYNESIGSANYGAAALVLFENHKYNFVEFDGTKWLTHDFDDYYGVPNTEGYTLVSYNGMWNFYTRDGKSLLDQDTSTPEEAIKAKHEMDDKNALPTGRGNINESRNYNLLKIRKNLDAFVMQVLRLKTPPQDFEFANFAFENFYNSTQIIVGYFRGIRFSNVVDRNGNLLFDEWFVKITPVNGSDNTDRIIAITRSHVADYHFQYNLMGNDFKLIFKDGITNIDQYSVNFDKEKLFLLYNGSNYNFLDSNGNILFDYWFDSVDNDSELAFDEGVIIVNLQNKSNIFSFKEKKMILPKWVDWIEECQHSHKYFTVGLNKRTNIIDLNGNFLLDNWANYIFSDIDYDPDTYQGVNHGCWFEVGISDKKNIYIADKKEYLFKEWLSDIKKVDEIDSEEWPDEDFAVTVQFQNGKYNHIKWSGEPWFNFNFDEYLGYPSDKGYCLIKVNGKWNYYNKQAKPLFKQPFDDPKKAEEEYCYYLNDDDNDEYSEHIEQMLNENTKHEDEIIQNFERNVSRHLLRRPVFLRYANGYSIVWIDSWCNLVKPNGRDVVFENQWFSNLIRIDGSPLSIIVNENGDYNLIDENCNLIFAQWVEDIHKANDDYTIYKLTLDRKINFYSVIENRLLSDIWFDGTWGYFGEEGAVIVEHKKKFNILKPDGTFVLKKNADDIFMSGFEKDMFWEVEMSQKWNIVDINGKQLSKIWFDLINVISEEETIDPNILFYVSLNGKGNYLKKDGTFVSKEWAKQIRLVDRSTRAKEREFMSDEIIAKVFDYKEGMEVVNFVTKSGDLWFKEWPYDVVGFPSKKRGLVIARFGNTWNIVDRNGNNYLSNGTHFSMDLLDTYNELVS